MMVLTLTLAAALLQGAPGAPKPSIPMLTTVPAMKTIDKGDHSNMDDAKQAAVEDRRGLEAAVAAAFARSSAPGGGLHEGDGRRRLHGQPAERRLHLENRQCDRGQRTLVVRIAKRRPRAAR
jgi:hypothetical protein